MGSERRRAMQSRMKRARNRERAKLFEVLRSDITICILKRWGNPHSLCTVKDSMWGSDVRIEPGLRSGEVDIGVEFTLKRVPYVIVAIGTRWHRDDRFDEQWSEVIAVIAEEADRY